MSSSRMLKAVDSQDGRIVAARVTPASSLWLQLVGLLGRKGLEPDEGMLFPYCCAIHTIGMRFALDVLLLDREGRILALWPELKPGRVVGRALLFAAILELPAGTIARANLQAGSRLSLLDAEGNRIQPVSGRIIER